MSDALRILVILLLVLGNAIFVAAEYALVTARRTRLEPEAQAGSRRAQAALARMENPVGFISTVQIGITVFGIALGAVGQPLLSDYFDSWLSNGIAYALAFLILTYLSVALGELVPKAVALQRAEPIAKVVAAPLGVLQRADRAVRLSAADLGERGRAPARASSPRAPATSRTRRRTSATSWPAPRTRA